MKLKLLLVFLFCFWLLPVFKIGAAFKEVIDSDLGVTVAKQSDLSAHMSATGTAVHGLGTISTQASGNVSITGGSITGVIGLYTSDLADYGAFSTITGFSSVANRRIGYKKIGKTVLVDFFISGTSNATTFSFTLPSTLANISYYYISVAVNGSDNSSHLTNAAELTINPNSNVANLYTNFNNGAWTASGTKTAYGQFRYEEQ